MEQVWKDITLAAHHDHMSADQDCSLTTPKHRNSNFILQDFLAGPFDKDAPSRLVSVTPCVASICGPPLLPPPATVLRLHSGPGFCFHENSGSLRRSSHSHRNPGSNAAAYSCNCSFEVVDSSAAMPSSSKRRAPDSDSSSGDRRHKRLIKNRESAARSRARKQAFTNELEQAAARLWEENARLRREHEELCWAAASRIPKKHSLHRSSSAPL